MELKGNMLCEYFSRNTMVQKELSEHENTSFLNSPSASSKIINKN